MATDARTETATSSFFATLTEVFSSAELQQSFRVVSRGILVHEAAETQLLEAYQRWLQNVTKSSAEKSTAKCRRRLFQSESPKLYYLLDGKVCIPGLLIPCEESISGNSKLPRSQANLLDTKSYLHARDPILSNIPNVEAILDPQQGLLLKIATKTTRFSLTPEVLKQFAETARGSENLVNELPKLAGPLRSCLEPLQLCLNRALQIEATTRLLIPSQFKKLPFSCFMKYRSLVFVSDQEHKSLIACYPIAETALSTFVRSELAENSGPIKTRQTPGRKPNPRVLGTLQIKRREFTVYARALLRFISAVTKVSSVKKELPSRYTVSDCVKQFRDLLQDAEKQDAPKQKPKRPQKGPKGKNKEAPPITLRNGPWFFQVTKGSHLIDCEIRYRPSKPHRGARPSADSKSQPNPRRSRRSPKHGKPRNNKPGPKPEQESKE